MIDKSKGNLRLTAFPTIAAAVHAINAFCEMKSKSERVQCVYIRRANDFRALITQSQH